MGVKSSKFEKKRNNNNTMSMYNQLEPEPVLTITQANMLKEIWESLKDDIQKMGVITFVNLFETHPEVQDVFMSFRAIEKSELEYNAILRAHALRVMGTVDKCIYRLDNREKLNELMTELGIRHKKYTVKIEYIDLTDGAPVYLINKTSFGNFVDRGTRGSMGEPLPIDVLSYEERNAQHLTILNDKQ